LQLVLSFVHPSRPPRSLGPFSRLWLDARSLRAEADGPVLAHHVRGEWHVEGDTYYRLDCAARVSIGFERHDGGRSRLFGPFASFSAVDGLAYTDSKIFAFLDKRAGAWLCYDLGDHYPLMVLGAAPASRGTVLCALVAASVCGLWGGGDPTQAAAAGTSAARSPLARQVGRHDGQRRMPLPTCRAAVARANDLYGRCRELLEELEASGARWCLLVLKARRERARARTIRNAARLSRGLARRQ
jgi:hypothetical protein